MQPTRALITGAGRRLGRAMAYGLAARGWAVAIHYCSSKADAEDTLEAVKKAGGEGVLVQADLADEAQVANLISDAAGQLDGPLHLLVNNASVFEPDELQTHQRADWDAHIEVNLRAPIRLSQALADQIPTGDKAAIINMLDQRVMKLNPHFFTYTLSKSALFAATRTMAQALAPNIRVNAIGPGPTLRNARQSDADFDKQKQATLTKQGASLDDIVRALLYLVDADAVTGQMIAVDGGQHLIWQTPDVLDVTE